MEGETVVGFNSIMLLNIRTIRQLYSDGEDITPILKHAEFMAKKSTLGAYRHDTYSEYDKLVRRRADRDGLKEFGLLATEEIATCFCPENMLKHEKNPVKMVNSKKKTPPHCRQYNEGQCQYKNCVYSHICMCCDEQGHGHVECPKLRAKGVVNK